MDKKGKSNKIVTTLGVANTFLLSLSTLPVAAGPPKKSDGDAQLVQRRAVVSQIKLQAEQISITQSGDILTLSIRGKPGRHVGVFMGTSSSRRSLKLAANTHTIIGRNGTARLTINLKTLGSRKFIANLVTADDMLFSKGVMETEAVEVEVTDKARLAGHNIDDLLMEDDSTYAVGCGLGGAGAGISFADRGGIVETSYLKRIEDQSATSGQLFSDSDSE